MLQFEFELLKSMEQIGLFSQLVYTKIAFWSIQMDNYGIKESSPERDLPWKGFWDNLFADKSVEPSLGVLAEPEELQDYFKIAYFLRVANPARVYLQW